MFYFQHGTCVDLNTKNLMLIKVVNLAKSFKAYKTLKQRNEVFFLLVS